MAERVKYGIRYEYKHMIGGDKIIWEKFIRRYPEWFEEVSYDVNIGEGVVLNYDWSEKDSDWAKKITQKRIDVVGYKGKNITIIEIKKRVELGTLGQLLGYKFLYEKENDLIGKTIFLLITEMIGKDDNDIMNDYSIPVIVV